MCSDYTEQQIEWFRQCLQKSIDDVRDTIDAFQQTSKGEKIKKESNRYLKEITTGKLEGKLLCIILENPTSKLIKGLDIISSRITDRKFGVRYNINHKSGMPFKIQYYDTEIIKKNRTLEHNGIDPRKPGLEHGLKVSDMLLRVEFNENGRVRELRMRSFDKNHKENIEAFNFGESFGGFDDILEQFYIMEHPKLVLNISGMNFQNRFINNLILTSNRGITNKVDSKYKI